MKTYFAFIKGHEGNFDWTFKFQATGFEDAEKHFDQEVFELDEVIETC